MIYPKVTIKHNHGEMTLLNATIKNGYISGTVLDGYEVSRLGHAMRTDIYTAGSVNGRQIWGQVPIEMAPGIYKVNCEFL
jgi:hypothetical protein